MGSFEFPDSPEFAAALQSADEEGLIAWGGDLSPELLLSAYRQGIFPWPVRPDLPIPWFCPKNRGILEFDRLHISSSLHKLLKKQPFHFSFDQAFGDVIQACADARAPETWITPAMSEAYQRLHALGHAHSVEVWDPHSGELVGGLYGVEVDGCFAGESMFHRTSNASKLALIHLMNHLHSRGLDWMDIQTLTPHLEAMGARLIDRGDFLSKLRRARFPARKLF